MTTKDALAIEFVERVYKRADRCLGQMNQSINDQVKSKKLVYGYAAVPRKRKTAAEVTKYTSQVPTVRFLVFEDTANAEEILKSIGFVTVLDYQKETSSKFSFLVEEINRKAVSNELIRQHVKFSVDC